MRDGITGQNACYSNETDSRSLISRDVISARGYSNEENRRNEGVLPRRFFRWLTNEFQRVQLSFREGIPRRVISFIIWNIAVHGDYRRLGLYAGESRDFLREVGRHNSPRSRTLLCEILVGKETFWENGHCCEERENRFYDRGYHFVRSRSAEENGKEMAENFSPLSPPYVKSHKLHVTSREFPVTSFYATSMGFVEFFRSPASHNWKFISFKCTCNVNVIH